MEDAEKLEMIETLKKVCRLIGCSGMSDNCPGSPNCEIIKKVVRERVDLLLFCEETEA
jgi:hypothetical protein